MGTVKIVTDSAQDFEPAFMEKMGITVVPLTVHFGDESYKDGYEIRGKEFYDKLVSSEFVARTSQPSPWVFQNVFSELTEDGSSVVAIFLSSALSGTYEAAQMAKESLPDRQIEVIDSKSASGMYGMMAILAQEMADAGKTFEEIVSAVYRMVEACVTLFSVDTLDYLARNGRIGKAEHLLGSLLHVKPILSIDEEGYVVGKEKIRGKNKTIPRMVDIMIEELGQGEELYVCISHANSPSEAETLKELAQDRLNINRFFETEIGAIIGAHTGPGTLALLAIPVKAV